MNINPESIDAIIFVTQTPDYKLPSTACIMQDKLGVKHLLLLLILVLRAQDLSMDFLQHVLS